MPGNGMRSAGDLIARGKGTDMPYQDERSRTVKLVMILLTVIIVGGAIYWAMASSS